MGPGGTTLHFRLKENRVVFQPLFSSSEQYSVEELLPSIWLLDRAVGDRPIVEVRCLDLVIDAASRLAHQSSHPGLRDLIDWWIVCRLNGEATYCSSPHSFGTTGLDTDLVDRLRSMVSNRSEGSRPVIEWMTMRRTYDSLIHDLQTKIGEWRNTKGIRNVGHLVNLLEDVVGEAIASLKAGIHPSRPLTNSEIDRLFKETDIHQGSNLFRQWSRNLKGAASSMNRAIDLLAQIKPFDLAEVRVEPVGNGKLSGLSDDFRQATSILLKSVLRDPPSRVPDLAAFFSELSGEDVSGINYGQLAVLAEAVDDGGISFPSYQELTRLRSVIPGLRKSGADMDLVELYLDAGLIDEARQELEALRQDQRNSQALISLSRSADRLVEALEGLHLLGFNSDHFLEEINDFRSQLGTEDSESMKARLSRIESSAIESSGPLLLAQSEEILQDIACMQTGERDITSKLVARRDDTFESGDLQSRLVLIEELRDLSHSIYEEKGKELRETVLRLQTYLHDDLDRDSVLSLVSRATDFDDGGKSVDDLMRLHDESVRLERELEEKKVATWRYSDGEQTLVAHITRFMMERTGFRELDIKRFYASLKTKRFVMLGGLPGTGKSIFSRVFCESVDCTSKNGRFFRVAVRPSWTDPVEILGRLDSINNVFVPGWLATLVARCHADSANLYFCLLDEMNLAPVEQYFAEMLSALEEESPNRDDRPMITLYSDGATPDNASDWPSRISLPVNLYFIGTVNFDPTTNSISDRVIDRGNFIQLATQIGREHHSDVFDFSEPRWILPQAEWQKAVSRNPISDSHDVLVEIGELLEDFRIGIGFRTHVEIERYLSNSRGFMSDVEAMDTAVLQRFIPKFRDSHASYHNSFKSLWERLDSMDLRLSAAVVRYWIDASSGSHISINGIDPFLGVVTSRIESKSQLESQPEVETSTVQMAEAAGEALNWEERFLRDESPLPRKQDELLRALVNWARKSDSATEIVRLGISCDEIVHFIRRLFGSADRDQLIRRIRSLINEEQKRDDESLKIDIIIRNNNNRIEEVLTYALRDGTSQPEGWRRRAVLEAPEQSSISNILIELIAWLTKDPETSELLRAGLDLGDIGSVARDIGYIKSSAPLKVGIQELLDSNPSFGDYLMLASKPTQVLLRWK